MRTLEEIDAAGLPTVRHIIVRTTSKGYERGMYFTRCDVILEGPIPIRTSKRQPTCVRCIGTVPGVIEIKFP